MKALTDVLKERNIAYARNVSGRELTTIGIGGAVSLVMYPLCVGELIDCVELCTMYGMPYAVVGRGSNLLISDTPERLVLIQTTALDAWRPLSENRIFALCGAPLVRLCVAAAKRGFSDLVFACGIPGSVGGAAYMNAGAYGGSMSDVVESVDIYDLSSHKIRTLFNNQLGYSYRNSVFKGENYVILSATLAMKGRGAPEKLFAQMRSCNAQRRARQPLELPSAGSAFKRVSQTISTARLIDEAGLGGYRIGGAQISEKHTGFIVNVGGATAADVKELMCVIQEKLEKKYGYRPDREICFLPEDL